jgi:hypothetical protein
MLDSNLTALEIKLESAALERLMGLALAPEEYWSQRSAMPWN